MTKSEAERAGKGAEWRANADKHNKKVAEKVKKDNEGGRGRVVVSRATSPAVAAAQFAASVAGRGSLTKRKSLPQPNLPP
jgi:hypothetical protein